MDENAFVVIGSFSQPHEAHLVQALLDSEGIESNLEGEYTIAANPLWSNALGGVRLAVSKSDMEPACRLLEEYRRGKAESEAKRARTCPQCQSEDVTAVNRPTFLKVLVVITLGAFSLLFPWAKYKCSKCGTKW